jgi:hypothetical protein
MRNKLNIFACFVFITITCLSIFLAINSLHIYNSTLEYILSNKINFIGKLRSYLIIVTFFSSPILLLILKYHFKYKKEEETKAIERQAQAALEKMSREREARAKEAQDKEARKFLAREDAERKAQEIAAQNKRISEKLALVTPGFAREAGAEEIPAIADLDQEIRRLEARFKEAQEKEAAAREIQEQAAQEREALEKNATQRRTLEKKERFRAAQAKADQENVAQEIDELLKLSSEREKEEARAEKVKEWGPKIQELLAQEAALAPKKKADQN